MLELPGYQVGEVLHAGDHSLVLRARRLVDSERVVLKTTALPKPTPDQVRRLHAERAISSRVRHAGVVKVLGLERIEHRSVLVLEDGGASLDQRPDPLDMASFLRVGISLADAVAALHDAGIAHRDINPTNILQDAAEQVRLCDLGHASLIARQDLSVADATHLEGTLRYISPEQTGRMNRSVDYRTDFYSLGATLFDLVAGRPPFVATDPVELVHCHLARRPPDLAELVPEAPPAVVAIILKLLAKTPEERYQTARGLRADLGECSDQLSRLGAVGSVEIGRRDRAAKFEIPDRIYGRGAEKNALLEAFEQAAAGNKQVILLRGYGGAGKSSLVHEIHKPVLQQRAWFATGKCDQLTQHVPYQPIVQAFDGLVHQLLASDERTLVQHRGHLAEALGDDAAALVQVAPALGALLGEVHQLPELPSAETESRFNRVVRAFLGSFARAGAPLVLFLDDLQWADTASLQVIQQLSAADAVSHLLLIGAYRADEVQAGRPLAPAIAELERTPQLTVRTIDVEGLKVSHLTLLVADTLHRSPSDVEPLAELLHDKTMGNPLFARQYLGELHRDGLLRFDEQSATWTWDPDPIAERGLADNVAELLIRRLRGLPDSTRRLLQLASCIGNTFDAVLLAVVAEAPIGAVMADLLPAVNERLLSPIGDAFNLALAGPELDSHSEGPLGPQDLSFGRGAIACRFLHDRIQRAAYSLLSQERRRSIRLRLGRLLLQNLSEEVLDRRLFEVVDHVNAGLGDLVDEAERLRFAELNLKAGSRARSATAYVDARRYIERGLALLPAEAWDQHYELAFALALGQLESACLAQQDLDEIEHLAQQLEQRARSEIDQAKVTTLRVDQLGARGRPEQALRVGLPLLERLGLQLRVSNPMTAMRESWNETRALLAGRSVAQAIAEVPTSEDPRHRAAIELFLKLGSPMYSIRRELVSLGSLEVVRLCLRNGNVSGSGMCYAAGGIEVAHELQDYEAGFELGKAGVNLAKSWGAHVGATRLLWGAFTRWLRHPLRDNLSLHQQGCRECLEVGDLVFASQHASMYAQTAVLSGITLPSIRDGLAPLDQPLRDTDLEEILICGLTHHFIDQLGADGPLDAEALQTPREAERSILQRMEQIPFPPGLHWYYLLRCRLLLFAGDGVAAARYGALSDQYAPNDVFSPRDLDYCRALALASACDEAQGDQRSIWRAELAGVQDRIARWADVIVVDNYLHKATLVEAEMARLARDEDTAEILYERAIVLARQFGATPDEALASERAAAFSLARDFPEVAASHLRNACYCYDKWGATSKVLQLEARYPELLAAESSGQGSLVHEFGAGSRAGGAAGQQALDLFSLLKASQTLSAEMVLETLLRKLLRMVIENAGAERGVLLLQHEGDLMVHAVSGIASDEVRLLDPTPLDQSGLLHQGIVNYVVRMHEDVVLDEASDAAAFRADPYMVDRHPRSVLCARIVGRAKLVGVIYLENNMVSGAFGQQRLEMVRVIAAQAAISIQNARLYDSLAQHSEEIAQLREQLELENEYLRAEVKTVQAFGNIVGSSAAMHKALEQVEMVAPTDASVLILGESGTGKELVAHAIHERSQRSKRPFIAANCASIPHELFESEFFGHVRGAFTGAVKDRVGRFQLADGGTLFLDEVGEIPPELQGKLLRVLQEGTVERVGEDRSHRVDVRIVAATNRDLEAEVQAGRFRQDLYYRLSVFPIQLSPLRARMEDVPALVQHFIEQSAPRLGVPTPRLTTAHVDQLQRYDWPGNVRELQNVVERALITAGVRGLCFDLPDSSASSTSPAPTPAEDPDSASRATGTTSQPVGVLTYADLKQLEHDNLLRALELSDWKVSGKDGAAARLGTKPSTLASRMKAMKIERPRSIDS